MLQPGDILQGRYLIERLIGTGGMGSVYLARQSMLGNRELAVKEVNFDSFREDEREAAMDQFRREAMILAQLKHPNLVDVKDCFEESGLVYLVMDYVEGNNLEELLEAHPTTPVPWEIMQDWSEQLCDVLEYLHTRRPPIIFRDLKPANVMLDANGLLHLIDFGIARVLEEDSMDLAELQGTPGYAPMEQLQVAGVVPDARTDIYALGATIFNLVTRQHPSNFWDDTEEAEAIRNTMPPALAGVVGKMMELRPDNRYRTISEARTALYKAYTEPMKSVAATRRVSLDQTVPTRRAGGLQDEAARKRRTELLSPPPPVMRNGPETGRLPTAHETTARTPTPAPTSWGSAQPPPAVTTSSPTRVHPPPPSVPTRSANGTGGLRTDPVVTGYVPDVFGRKMELVFTAFRNNKLTLYCPKKPRLGFPLKAFFTDGTRPPQEVSLSLSDTVRSETGIQYEVEVRNMPNYMVPLLTRQLAPKEVRHEQRRLPRMPISFQVTSPELPGYKALAMDLSLLGIRLHMSGSLEVGRSIALNLDLDDSMSVKVTAECRWCAADPKRGYQAGFKFAALSREAVMALDAFMQKAGGKSTQLRI